MIVKMNGNFSFDTVEPSVVPERVQKGTNPNWRKVAIPLWTTSGMMFSKVAYAGGFYDRMQPLIDQFQEMALGMGVLGLMAGLGILAFQKRWGKATLKTTAFIVGGVFLAPSAIMLFAIIAMTLNDALLHAFQQVQGSNVKGVMGK